MRVPRRPTVQAIREHFGDKPIVGAEVGVGAGWNACDMLMCLPNLKLLYLIDPHQIYDGYVDPELVFSKEKSKEMIEEEWKEKATQRVSKFGDRKKWVRKRFEETTLEDVPQKLDFIYIDGNHLYEYVKNDIIHSIPFMKPDSIVGGHDYTDRRFGEDVQRAVKEYCKEHEIEHHHEKNDWWFYL